MQTTSTQTHLKTSLSLPRVTHRRLQGAQILLVHHGQFYSEQELFRRLFKFYLRFWRGRGKKTNGLRRYNRDGRDYVIRPFYVDGVLHGALWQRALHSGESLSRMLDLAIRIYLPRLLESLLARVTGCADWRRRFEHRRNRFAELFINYACETQENDGQNLTYAQRTKIFTETTPSEKSQK